MSRRRLLSSFSLAIPLALWCASVGAAWAQEGAVLPPAVAGGSPDLSAYLMGMGPIGALAYGAFLIGKVSKEGIRLTVQVDLSEVDRKLLERSVDAIEVRAARRRTGDA
jgi:hypothetical protein